MKKIMLECKLHGLVLHRCKRKYWNIAKDKIISDYTEKCYKCIEEGKYNNAPKTKKRNAHTKV